MAEQISTFLCNTSKVCFHTIIFTLDQIIYFIKFIYLTFPNLAQSQLGAYSLNIEVRWSALRASTEGYDYLQLV